MRQKHLIDHDLNTCKDNGSQESDLVRLVLVFDRGLITLEVLSHILVRCERATSVEWVGMACHKNTPFKLFLIQKFLRVEPRAEML
jgi:hypothetical protein